MKFTQIQLMQSMGHLILQDKFDQVTDLMIDDEAFTFRDDEYSHSVKIEYISDGNFTMTHYYIDFDTNEEEEHIAENLDLYGMRELLENPPY